MAARVVRDCTKCGACCRSDRQEKPGYVYLSLEDAERIRRKHPRMPIVQERVPPFAAHVELGTRETKDGCVCAALRGRIGVKVTCAIYKDRPQLCREFLKGSGDCRFARRFWGWDPSEA